ncbi:Fe-S cluster assembly protein SufD [Afipia carboxidovorans]|uniref:Fe-S cluster assembly protein SufD n=1 Tax=Afipia carboxidovorans TaxID=40137 RepID=UPI0030D28AA6
MMNIAATAAAGTPPADVFAAARDRLPGEGPVATARKAAFEDFTSRGLPHRRIEEWKYTDLRALLRAVAPLAPVPGDAALALAAKAQAAIGIENATRLTLVDGVLAPKLSDLASLPKGVRVRSLRESLTAGAVDLLKTTFAADAMISFNGAMATDGVLVEVDDGVTLERPLYIAHVATASSASSVTRSKIQIGKKARVTLVESFVAAGASAYQVHDQVDISVGDDSELQHIRLMEDARDAANITTAAFTLGARVKLNTFGLNQGAAVSRYQGFISFLGEDSELSTNGVNLLGGRRHADTTLVVNHAVPNCTSREIFRAVLDDQSRSVFQGRIIVQQDAQKTDGKMMTRALLLSDEAEADNKPELEIFADDVACGHGATAGALDEELLFYLRARGLPENEAQSLLISAFVGEAIESIVDDGLRELAITTAERWLAARG